MCSTCEHLTQSISSFLLTNFVFTSTAVTRPVPCKLIECSKVMMPEGAGPFSEITAHAPMTMIMTMTLREVQHLSMEGLAFAGVSVGVMTPRKKESVALMWLALLASCALAHC